MNIEQLDPEVRALWEDPEWCFRLMKYRLGEYGCQAMSEAPPACREAVLAAPMTPAFLGGLINGYGLSVESICRAGIAWVSEEDAQKLTGVPEAGFGHVVPYPRMLPGMFSENHLGTPLDPDRYWRLCLWDPVRLDAEADPVWDLGPPGEGPRMYVPPLAPFTDGDLALPGGQLWIADDELGALASTQDDMPCLGLPGVWGLKEDDGCDLLELFPELRGIAWEDRQVVLECGVESDGSCHPSSEAIDRLERALETLGAEVEVREWEA